MEFMARFEEKMSSLDERHLELSTQKKKMEEELKVLTAKLDNLNSSYQGKETIRLDPIIKPELIFNTCNVFWPRQQLAWARTMCMLLSVVSLIHSFIHLFIYSVHCNSHLEPLWF